MKIKLGKYKQEPSLYEGLINRKKALLASIRSCDFDLIVGNLVDLVGWFNDYRDVYGRTPTGDLSPRNTYREIKEALNNYCGCKLK